MDKITSDLRTFFQEWMSITSPTTPPRAGQRGQDRERFEPYGEGSSLGAASRTLASSYGQHSQPPTNSLGQPQQTWANPSPTYPAETLQGQLQTTAPIFPLGSQFQSNSIVPTATLTHSASQFQHGPTRPNQMAAPLRQVDRTHPGQAHNAYQVQFGSVTTAEPLAPIAQQLRPQNDAQQVQQPFAAQLESPPQWLRVEDVRQMIEDGLA
ncbi:uncharacterized protein LOC110747355 [Prunus avium]|uniref:Uncharacterized protein LOC110747355 n=1 Tax=Prunus avium TaxID=42229 RepID=A0A6P5RJS1_PRUAV|nr:uncharacterized protein LOC110747355 [Prunus avium]